MRQQPAKTRTRDLSGETVLTSDLARHIGFLVRKMYQKNQMIWQTMCPDPQLTSVQFAVLTTISRHGPSSLTDIGRSAAMDSATTRGVVDRLRARQLVDLESDASDRRKVIVRLERAGERIIKDMHAIMPRIAEATLHPLNPAEQLALEFLLVKATDDAGNAA